MQIELIYLSDLKKPQKNVRIHTQKQIEEIQRSLKMFGQTRAIVIDENNTVLCGNGLVAAMTVMGFEEVSAYRISHLTENQKKKLMIADNKTQSLGLDDLDTITEFINDLKDELDIPGFDDDILEAMVCEAEEITEKITDYGTLSQEQIDKMQGARDRREDITEKGGLETIREERREERETTLMSTSQNVSTSVQAEPIGIETNMQKVVVCPHCGEKICVQ